MKVGYVRVSTEEQNTARQDEMMNTLGVEKVFVDHMSGKDTERPGLNDMMKFVREGDIVIVESISRFARSTRDLLKLVEELKEKKVEFISQKETIDTTTPQGEFMLTIFAAMADLERKQILQRQREGIEIAKAEGKYTGRKPIELDEDEFVDIHRKWYKDEITTNHALKTLGVSRSTFYRRVWEYEDKMGMPYKNKRRDNE